MKKPIGVLFGILFLAVPLVLFLINKNILTARNPENTSGMQTYTTYCANCHGELGKGDGKLSYLLYPKPRDFTRGTFKLRSTPSGQVPTDEDLLKTLRAGMPGTAMPSFYYLRESQLRLVIRYVKALSQECAPGVPCKKHFEGPPPQSIPMPKALPYSTELVAKGQAAYKQLGCFQCHGESGKGDGLSAAGLKDNWGYPIKVRDFTQGTYLGGGRPEDLYLRFMAGMDGTPMPSFGSTLQYLGKTDQERQELIWGLIYYVKSLETAQSKSTAAPPKDGILAAARTDDWKKDSDLLNPFDPDWEKVTAVRIPLSRLWQKDNNNSVPIQVRARYNAGYVAILLEWNDATPDTGTYGIQDFQDGAGVQFSMTDQPGFHGMGSRTNPVDIWYWRAEWQKRKDSGSGSNMKLRYERRTTDADNKQYPGEIAEESRLSGRDAGNDVSVQVITNPVEELNAVGPGTLTAQPAPEQNILGRGEWNGNVWRVVFVRKWDDGDKNDVRFKSGGAIPVAFAVWNGSERDRNGQKLVSTWYTLKFQQ